jgi:hypothetical protein
MGVCALWYLRLNFTNQAHASGMLVLRSLLPPVPDHHVTSAVCIHQQYVVLGFMVVPGPRGALLSAPQTALHQHGVELTSCPSNGPAAVVASRQAPQDAWHLVHLFVLFAAAVTFVMSVFGAHNWRLPQTAQVCLCSAETGSYRHLVVRPAGMCGAFVGPPCSRSGAKKKVMGIRMIHLLHIFTGPSQFV